MSTVRMPGHCPANLYPRPRTVIINRGCRPVMLLAKEFELLRYFIQHPGETLSREELLTEVWGYGVVPSTRTSESAPSSSAFSTIAPALHGDLLFCHCQIQADG
jgi:hypothetical protein